MEKIESVEIDYPPQPKVTSASLMVMGESGDAIGLSKRYDANTESS